MSLASHTHHKVRLSCTARHVDFQGGNHSSQPLLGMEWSDAMALSIVVGFPDLAQIYMEPMETASSNLHVSGLTYSSQGAPFMFVYSQTLIFREAHLSSAPTGHGHGME